MKIHKPKTRERIYRLRAEIESVRAMVILHSSWSHAERERASDMRDQAQRLRRSLDEWKERFLANGTQI